MAPTRDFCCAILIGLSALLAVAPTCAAPAKLEVEVFQGGFATVNSFIFSNGKSLLVMDVQRKTYEAKKLADRVRARNLPLSTI